MVQIFVKGVQPVSMVLELEQELLVHELKLLLQISNGIPACCQGLVHEGKQLQDTCTLSSYGISELSTVHFVPRIRGGKGGFGAQLRAAGRDGKITDNYDACRDLTGRRLRHVNADEKLAAWQASARERELEKLAMQHVKDMEKAAKRQEQQKVDVDDVKASLQEASSRVAGAVAEALAVGQGLAGQGKRALPAGGADEAAPPAKMPRKSGMMAQLEVYGSDQDDDDDDDEGGEE